MVKKILVLVHKWLGVALALFFLMWFVSGVVLYFVPFPSLTPTERLTALPLLQLPAPCCLTAVEAAERAGLRAGANSEARLGMLGDSPVWRLQGRPASAGEAEPVRWHTVDARTGTLVPPLTLAQAAGVAEAFSGQQASGTELIERDQWTVPQGLDMHRPLVKVTIDSGDGLVLYVSPGAAEVVRDTRRAERFWNWLGAVPHWIYPTVLRQFPNAWHHVVVWLSIPGVFLSATGIALGIWQLFLNRRRWIPYRKFWMRWHHILGLAGAVFTLTWMFSGLMSMNPFGVFSGRSVDPQARSLWAGKPPLLARNPADAVALVAARGMKPLELDILSIAGQAWYRVRGQGGTGVVQRLIRADGPEPTVAMAVPDTAVQAALNALRPGKPLPEIQLLAHYDDLYYARQQDASTPFYRPLPIWRARWQADGVAVYADAASARIVMRADATTPWQRVLYNGLHSLDFAPLVSRPLLRTTLIVGLSLLGTALCITSVVVAWRVFSPGHPRRRLAQHKAGALHTST
jgi:hypothetical protein